MVKLDSGFMMGEKEAKGKAEEKMAAGRRTHVTENVKEGDGGVHRGIT